MTYSINYSIEAANSAAFTMAADLYLMQQCVERQCMFLRFYEWEPAAISIGSLQRASEQLDLPSMKHDGIDWVRRPTGGRAVLHREDLTYSCIFPKNLPGTGSSVAATYTLIMQCLVQGLKSLGITPEVHDSVDPLIKSGRHVKLPCFLAPNRNEIMLQGRKLIGSAQYRSKDAVLQHGSLPLTLESTHLPNYLLLDDNEKREQCALLEQKSICLAEIAPKVTASELATALLGGFADVLKAPLVEAPITGEIKHAIVQLSRSSQFIEQRLHDPE